ncbi:MAG: methionyl-tRNA formyltransferase [Sphingobium sp.]
MRIIYMGTPDFAVPALERLVADGHDIVAVYSQPPRPAGRGKALRPSAVHMRAEALGIELRTPLSLKDAAVQAEFTALDADVAVVAAYGLILPRAVLDVPRHGCLNIHASLLPRWRGAAPVQRAILAGDVETGVTIMGMEAGLDTGPTRHISPTPIGDYDTTGILTNRLAHLGAEAIVRVLRDLDAYLPEPQPDDGVTYAAKIDKAEARIDFTEGALAVQRQIRAFNPAPGAWFEVNGERIRVLEAAILTAAPDDWRIDFPTEPGTVLGDQLAISCGSGAVRPLWVQRAGRGAMDTLELLRGFPIPPGTHLL